MLFSFCRFIDFSKALRDCNAVRDAQKIGWRKMQLQINRNEKTDTLKIQHNDVAQQGRNQV